MASINMTNASPARLRDRLVSLGRACRQTAAAGAMSALVLGCATQQPNASQEGQMLAESGQEVNTLNAAERAAGWRLLFDGRSMSGWRGYKADTLPAGWRAANGSLTKNIVTDDIITRDQFGDFDLVFEWKVGRGGNAGVFYRATEEYEKVYWSGTEFQLLDDANARDGANRLTAAGAAYGLYPAPAGIVKPGGEWNTARIIANGPHVEHWLNGRKLLEFEAWSPDWMAKVQAAKFSEWPNYGRARRGHIAIQGDHEGDLELRNIKIREIR